MPPKKSSKLDYSHFFDDEKYPELIKNCEDLGTKDFLLSLAKALGIPSKTYKKKEDVCTAIKTRADILRSRVKAISEDSSRSSQIAEASEYISKKMVDEAIGLSEPRIYEAEVRPPSRLSSRQPTPAASEQILVVDKDLKNEARLYLIDCYDNKKLVSDKGFKKHLSEKGIKAEEADIDAAYKEVMSTIIKFKTIAERKKALELELSLPSEQIRPVSHPSGPEPPREPTPVPQPQIFEIKPVVKKWLLSKGVTIDKPLTKDELCDLVLDKVATEEEECDKRITQYTQKITQLEKTLQLAENKLQEKLKELEEARKAKKEPEQIAAIEEAARDLSEIADSVSEVVEQTQEQVQEQIAEEEARKKTCYQLREWAGDDAVSVEAAASDLSCEGTEVCDLATSRCVSASSVSGHKEVELADKKIRLAPLDKAQEVIGKIEGKKEEKACYALPIHATEQDLITDLDCGSGMVCDVSSKKCVDERKLTADMVSTITFTNGQSLKVTGENKATIVDLIKKEIAGFQQKMTTGARVSTKPIDLQQLLSALQTKRIERKSAVASQVMISEKSLREKIRGCLSLPK